MKRALITGAVLLGVVAVATVVCPGVPTPVAVAQSVARENGSRSTSCEVEVRGARTCAVSPSGSGSDLVEVTRRGRCWQGVRTSVSGAVPPAPARTRGCVRLVEDLRPAQRLLRLRPPDAALPVGSLSG